MKRILSLLLTLALLCSLCTAFAMGAPTSSAESLAQRALATVAEEELPMLKLASREAVETGVEKSATRRNAPGFLCLAPLVQTPSAVRGEVLYLRNLLYCNDNANEYFFVAIYPKGSDMEEEPLAYYAEQIPEEDCVEELVLEWDGYAETGYSDFTVVYFTVLYSGDQAYIQEDTLIEFNAKIFDTPQPATGLTLRESRTGGDFFSGTILNKICIELESVDYFAVNATPDQCTTQSDLKLSYDDAYLYAYDVQGLLEISGLDIGWTTLTMSIDQAKVSIPVEICVGSTGHSVKTEVLSQPTEDSNGVTRYTCELCGATREERTWLSPRVFDTFTDISEKDWFCSAVQFAVDRGLFNGVAKDRFAPNDVMTRAMLVTVLYRYSGESVAYEPVFEDVPKGIWYSEAVTWAAKNEIVNGMGKGKFAPDGTITREQLATILYRYANKLGADTSKRDSLDFPDLDKLSSWAKDGVQWAVAEGLIQGSSVGGVVQLLPDQGATRAQVATILMRFVRNIKVPEASA